MQRRLSKHVCLKTQRGMQYLVHLLNDRASSSYVALAGLHHNLLAHPHDRLPEGYVGEGSAHSAGTHFQLHLHGAYEALVSCAEEALPIGITIKLHITPNCHVNLQQLQNTLTWLDTKVKLVPGKHPGDSEWLVTAWTGPEKRMAMWGCI